MIKELASAENPLNSSKSCFKITAEESDNLKEGEGFYMLTLQSEEEGVWLGRDGALVRVEANGGTYVASPVLKP